MTVSATVAALFCWVLGIAIFFVWFYGSKLADCKDRLEQQQKINRHNDATHNAEVAMLISGILARANVRELPNLNSVKWSALVDLYDTPEMMTYRIPAQITTDHDDKPTIYWKVTEVTDLDSYEIARLWLAGVLH